MTNSLLLPRNPFCRTFPSKPNGSRNSASTENLAEELLPFTVRIVRNEKDLIKAVHIRQEAYGRHLPQLAEVLKHPEDLDTQDGVIVLLAESKLDGSPLGTMRIQTNRFTRLILEQSVTLPPWLQGKALAEATRLGITNDRIGRIVKNVLFKAYFNYCQHTGVEWMVIAGRSPIDRQYQRLLFNDVYPDLGFIPLKHASDLPHRIMSFEVGTAEERWAKAAHPLFSFIFKTVHPDIQLLDSNPNAGGKAYTSENARSTVMDL